MKLRIIHFDSTTVPNNTKGYYRKILNYRIKNRQGKLFSGV